MKKLVKKKFQKIKNLRIFDMETINISEKIIWCTSRLEFEELWNTEIFNWKKYSHYLCKYCSKYFKIWWDSEKFNWEYYSDLLSKYCSKYFNIWWDSGKFDWKYVNYLQKYCQNYKNVWEKDYIKWKLITI